MFPFFRKSLLLPVFLHVLHIYAYYVDTIFKVVPFLKKAFLSRLYFLFYLWYKEEYSSNYNSITKELSV